MAKKNPEGAETAPVVYTVREPLRHDGESYEVGEAISLPPRDASRLLAAGVLATPAPDLSVSKE